MAEKLCSEILFYSQNGKIKNKTIVDKSTNLPHTISNELNSSAYSHTLSHISLTRNSNIDTLTKSTHSGFYNLPTSNNNFNSAAYTSSASCSSITSKSQSSQIDNSKNYMQLIKRQVSNSNLVKNH